MKLYGNKDAIKKLTIKYSSAIMSGNKKVDKIHKYVPHACSTCIVGIGGGGPVPPVFSSSELGWEVLSTFSMLTLVSRDGTIFSSKPAAWRALSKRSSDIVSAFWSRPLLFDGDPDVELNWNDLDLLVFPFVVALVIF